MIKINKIIARIIIISLFFFISAPHAGASSVSYQNTKEAAREAVWKTITSGQGSSATVAVMDEDKIIYSEDINDWKESINISGNKLVDLKHVNEEYICEVINTIETFGSYFVLGNNIAIPHGQIFKNVYKSSISVLFMKEPVVFPGNKSVSLIFFLAALTKHEHLGTLSDIFNLAKNENFLLDLNTVKKSSELYTLIKKYVGYTK